MANVNRVILIGNLTRDPELRSTPKGTAVVELGLAINRKIKTDSGDKEETTFIDITAWGKTAEIMGQYLKKGSCIYVEGRLQLDTWQDKETGQNRSKLKVVAESFQFLDLKPQGQSRQQQRNFGQEAPNGYAQDRDGNDIPF